MSQKDISIEQNVLGLLLDDGSRITQCDLEKEDFSVKSHQVIYESILQVLSNDNIVDVVSVGSIIEREYNNNVDMPYMIELITKCAASPDNLKHFCEITKKASELRQAKTILSRSLFELDGNDNKNVVSETIKQLMDLDRASKKYEHTMKDAVIAAMEIYEEASKRGGLIGITSGLSELDDALGGFHPSDLIIVGARPAVGKTALAFNFALTSTSPVGVISAEQDHSQAGLRFIAMEGLINSKNFRSANMTELEYGRMPRTVQNLKDRQIFFNDETGIDINSLQRQARRWKHERNIGMLVVDYIQKIKGSVKGQGSTDRVTDVVTTLKDLAKELQIPVIALSQVNRAADQIDGPPGPGHLSDASACEKEADTIITMYRNDDMQARGKTLLHICKNRHGPTGDVLVDYQGPYFKFTDEQSYSR